MSEALGNIGSITPPSADAITAAAEHLKLGRLVVLPTETVYGLAADATNGKAVAAVYAAKGRPLFNPLIVHFADMRGLERVAVLTKRARRLGETFWPGPLTLVLERRPGCGLSELVSAGLDTVAVRIPAHPVALAVIAATGRPLAAPSANRSGRVSPTTAEHVARDLGANVAMILDGGPTRHGLESTVVDARGEALVLLRPGAVTADAIESVTGAALTRHLTENAMPLSPGQLASHYAPRATVRLNALEQRPGEALLAFGAPLAWHSGPVINLSPRGDLVEAAANLFAALRKLDATGAKTIAVMPIPSYRLGEAINDRLVKAAAPRPEWVP